MATQLTRPLRTLAAALAVIGVALVAAAPRAFAADMACNYDSTFNACLSFDYLDYLWYDVHVGVDVHMAEDARAIIRCGGNFTAELKGDDGSNNGEHITDLALAPGWPSAGPDGLGVEFVTRYVNSSQLDEDDGRDELHAKITYFDCNTRLTNTLWTSDIVGYFG
jgi:hypothetical protein